jgi:hypothetical protein
MSTRALSQDDLSERDAVLEVVAAASLAIADLAERMIRREDYRRSDLLKLAYFASQRVGAQVEQAFG